MIHATILTLALLAQATTGGGFAGRSDPDAPSTAGPKYTGSRLDPADAARRADAIVAGRVEKIAPTWTYRGADLEATFDVQLAGSWRGPAVREARRRFGLVMARGEGWPDTGADCLLFLARRRDRDEVIKVLPRNGTHVAALRALGLVEAPANPAAPDLDPVPAALTGARVDLADATRRATSILVGRALGSVGLVEVGPIVGTTVALAPATALKGPAPDPAVRDVAITALAGESLPAAGRDYAFFLADRPDADPLFKVAPATPATLAAIKQALAVEPAPAEAAGPGDAAGRGLAADRAAVIFVGRVAATRILATPADDCRARLALDPGAVLRGRLRDVDLAGIEINARNPAGLPKPGEEVIVFAEPPLGAASRTWTVPATPANVEAARRAIRADDARALPADAAPGVEPHTIVAAEVAAGALVDAGGVGLGWCELRSATALRGDARAVVGRRLDYTTYRGRLAPAVGGLYLFEVGTVHGRDAILAVRPATLWGLRVASLVAEHRRAFQAGASRHLAGEELPVDAAAARAHTVVVATIAEGGGRVAVGGVLVQHNFRVAATLKGPALPGDHLAPSYWDSMGSLPPQVGESFLVFVGQVGAGSGNADTVLKLLPATPDHVAATRDRITAAVTPVAAR